MPVAFPAQASPSAVPVPAVSVPVSAVSAPVSAPVSAGSALRPFGSSAAGGQVLHGREICGSLFINIILISYPEVEQLEIGWKLDDKYVCIHRIAEKGEWWSQIWKNPRDASRSHWLRCENWKTTSFRPIELLSPKPATSQLDPMVNQCFVTSFKGLLCHMLFLPSNQISTKRRISLACVDTDGVDCLTTLNPHRCEPWQCHTNDFQLCQEWIDLRMPQLFRGCIRWLVKYDSKFAPDGLTNPYNNVPRPSVSNKFMIYNDQSLLLYMIFCWGLWPKV